MKATKAQPTLHQEFLAARQKYICMKKANPNLTLRSSQDLYPPRLVSMKQQQTDRVSAPKYYLCELSVYKSGEKIQGVMVTRDEDEGMFAIEAVEDCFCRSKSCCT